MSDGTPEKVYRCNNNYTCSNVRYRHQVSVTCEFITLWNGCENVSESPRAPRALSATLHILTLYLKGNAAVNKVLKLETCHHYAS